MSRDIAARAERLGEDGIVLGPLEQVQEARIREHRAAVPRHRVGDLGVASHDENIGDLARQRRPLRYRQQMTLALAAGVLDEACGADAVRVLQHRAGNLDRIVEGELPGNIGRGAIEARKLPGKTAARGDLDFLGEALDHFAEGPDLLVAELAGDQEIRGVPERLQPGFASSQRNRVVQLFQIGMTFHLQNHNMK
jgi:hypothetical protein